MLRLRRIPLFFSTTSPTPPPLPAYGTHFSSRPTTQYGLSSSLSSRQPQPPKAMDSHCHQGCAWQCMDAIPFPPFLIYSVTDINSSAVLSHTQPRISNASLLRM